MNSTTAQSFSMPLSRDSTKKIMNGSKLPNKVRNVDKEYVEPTENDILRGRGGRINAHPGKQRLLDLVRAQGDRYAVLKRGQKGKMGQEIVREVHAWGGRFLEMEKGSDGVERYFVLDQKAAIKLVEQKFRDDPTKRKSKCATQSKKAIRNQKKRAYGQAGVSTPSKVSSMKPQSVDDEDDSLVEMELCQDVCASHHSRRAMAAKVNEALLNLELTFPEDTRQFRCVTPTNSFFEQQKGTNKSAERAQGGVACDEVSLSDASSTWNMQAEQARFDVLEELDLNAFFTGDDNEVDTMFPADAIDCL